MSNLSSGREASRHSACVNGPTAVVKNPQEIVKDFFTTVDVSFTRALNRGVMLHMYVCIYVPPHDIIPILEFSTTYNVDL